MRWTDEFSVGVAVLHDQDAHAGKRRQCPGRIRSRTVHAVRQRGRQDPHAVQGPRGNRHGERAALADFTGDADSSTEGLCNPATDRQPQTCAAELAGYRVVGLHEGIEDGLELFRGDADARIEHLNHKLRIEFVIHQSSNESEPFPPG